MKNNKSIQIRDNNTSKFLGLAIHIVAMENDAYLTGHPEWDVIVKEAKKALKAENISPKQIAHR